MERWVDKSFRIAVGTPGISYARKFDLDRNIKLVRGIQLNASDPQQAFYRGTIRLELSGDELYPEDYDFKNLMSGQSVAPDERFAQLGNGVLAGNGELKILYKDVENPFMFFRLYEICITLRCEMK